MSADGTNGFDWDEGNWPKCGKHGVSKREIERVFAEGPSVSLDKGSHSEPRFIAVARIDLRFVYVAFTFRRRRGHRLVRPISARYMHAKEVRRYVRQAIEEVSDVRD